MTDEANKGPELSAEQLVAKGQAAAQQAEMERIAQEQIEFEKDLKAKLRENGKLLGLTFAPNASVQLMHQQLTEARAQIENDEPTVVEADLPLSEQDLRKKLKLDNLKLVRIRISCLNPNKAGLPGEILCVHNDIVGTVKKYVPYNEAGEAYHVPFILLKMMKRKRFLQIKDPPKGSRAAPTTKMVPEYGIEILEQLSPKELEDLKRAQGAASSQDDDEA